MAATLNRILAKVEQLGENYFVLHSEIKPMVLVQEDLY